MHCCIVESAYVIANQTSTLSNRRRDAPVPRPYPPSRPSPLLCKHNDARARLSWTLEKSPWTLEKTQPLCARDAGHKLNFALGLSIALKRFAYEHHILYDKPGVMPLKYLNNFPTKNFRPFPLYS